MYKKCPGADSFMKPHPEFIKCPYCKKEIEMWTDDTEIKCEHCGKIVRRSGLLSCVDWCKYAKECIGEEKYKEYQKKKKNKK